MPPQTHTVTLYRPCLLSLRTPKSRYPKLLRDGKVQSLHKYLWQEKYGPVPHNMKLIHLCGQDRCHEMTHIVMSPGQKDVSR